MRFYTYANPGDAVGFFGNRDHFAALLYAALVFTSVWMIDVSFRFGSWEDLRSSHQFTVVTATAVFMTFVVLLVGEAVARSRAGLGLTMIGLLTIFALAFTDERRRSKASSSKIVLGAIGVAGILCVQFALYRILDRFTADPLADARILFAKKTIGAAWTFTPFGSGLGSFVPVYQMFEKPVDTLVGVYVNHAHNDYLELWLETGVMGVIVICLFAYWVGSNGVKVWRDHSPNTSAFDHMLARAATVVIALLLVHALVDFSLQTEAIMAVFAVSCALLVAPCRIAEQGMRVALESGRATTRPRPGLAAAMLASPATAAASGSLLQKPMVPARRPEVPLPEPRATGGRWGEDIQWPDEWQNPQEENKRTPGAAKSGPAGDADPDGTGSGEGSSSGPETSD